MGGSSIYQNELCMFTFPQKLFHSVISFLSYSFLYSYKVYIIIYD